MEAEVGLGIEDVVVGVVVKAPEAVPVCDGGDDQVNGRESVMSRAGELSLCVDCAAFDRFVDVEQREPSSSAIKAEWSMALRAE